MRQPIVDLKIEYADFPDGVIAAICAIDAKARGASTARRVSTYNALKQSDIFVAERLCGRIICTSQS